MVGKDEPTLLLIDDNQAYLDVLVEQLAETSHSFDFITKSDSRAAVEAFGTREDIDCIICDYQMPQMDGLEVLEQIRSINSEIPFILFTSQGSEDIASQAINAGSTRYLQKRSRLEEIQSLADMIVEDVQQYEQQQTLRNQRILIERLFGSIDDVVYITDRDGNLIYWNGALVQLTGFSNEEIQQFELFELVSDGDLEKLQHLRTLPLEEVPSRIEFSLKKADGQTVPVEFSQTVLRDDTGEIIGFCGIGREISARKQYERALRGLHEITRELLQVDSREEIAQVLANATDQIIDNSICIVQLREEDRLVPVAVPDETKTVLPNPPTYHVEEDTPVTRVYRSGVPEQYRDIGEIDDDRDRGLLRQAYYYPLGSHGTLILGLVDTKPLSDSAQRLAEILADNGTAALNQYEQKSELQGRGRMLATLHETTQELMQSRDREDIASITVTAANTILGLPAVAVYLWNDETGVLEPVAASDKTCELLDEIPVLEGGDSIAWEVFVEGQTRHVTEVSQVDSVYDPETAIRSALFVPLGEAGLLLAGTAGSEGVTETDIEFTELLASSAEVAIKRTERELALQRQESQLEQKNEHLYRLNRINKIIRDITRGLVNADTHAEIDRAVCEHLTDAEHYLFAWTGEYDPSTGVDIHEWAGEGKEFLTTLQESKSIDEDIRPLPVQAMQSEEPVIVQNILRDDVFEPWRKNALDNGFRSVACFPLIDRNHYHGFFEIYGDRPNLFTDEEISVLTELAAHIANSISAVQRKEALLSGHTIALDFEVEPINDPLFNLSKTADCALDIEALTPQQGSSWLVYAKLDAADPTDVLSVARNTMSIEGADLLIGGGNSPLLALVITDLPLASTLTEQGGSIQSLHAAQGSGRVSVTLSSSADVRSFVEKCTSSIPELGLIRRQVIPSQASSGLKYNISDLLTNKQLQALQAAYYEGYFEWPRDSTGEDIAESIGVSGPTFQQHIRKGLNRIFRDAFESEQKERRS